MRRALFVFVVLVVGPLAAYIVAVNAAGPGFGIGDFLLVLFGLPVLVAVLAARFLRRTPRGTAGGIAGALVAAYALLAVVVFATLAGR